MSEPTIRYASVCSGVEAASLAWEKLDWKPVWFSEVEPFPCKVLAERFGASSPVNPLDPADTHCPDYSALEVELADAVIRIMDYAHARSLDIAGAIIAKMGYNQTHPMRHGGKRF